MTLDLALAHIRHGLMDGKQYAALIESELAERAARVDALEGTLAAAEYACDFHADVNANRAREDLQVTDLIADVREALRVGSPRGEEGAAAAELYRQSERAGVTGSVGDVLPLPSSPDGAPPEPEATAGATAPQSPVVVRERLPMTAYRRGSLQAAAEACCTPLKPHAGNPPEDGRRHWWILPGRDFPCGSLGAPGKDTT